MLPRYRRKSLSAEDFYLGSSSPVHPRTPEPTYFDSNYPSPRIASSSSGSPDNFRYPRFTETASRYAVIPDKGKYYLSLNAEDGDDLPPASDFEMDYSSSLLDSEEFEQSREEEENSSQDTRDEAERKLHYEVSAERGRWATDPLPVLHPKPHTFRANETPLFPVSKINRDMLGRTQTEAHPSISMTSRSKVIPSSIAAVSVSEIETAVSPHITAKDIDSLKSVKQDEYEPAWPSPPPLESLLPHEETVNRMPRSAILSEAPEVIDLFPPLPSSTDVLSTKSVNLCRRDSETANRASKVNSTQLKKAIITQLPNTKKVVGRLPSSSSASSSLFNAKATASTRPFGLGITLSDNISVSNCSSDKEQDLTQDQKSLRTKKKNRSAKRLDPPVTHAGSSRKRQKVKMSGRKPDTNDCSRVASDTFRRPPMIETPLSVNTSTPSIVSLETTSELTGLIIEQLALARATALSTSALSSAVRAAHPAMAVDILSNKRSDSDDCFDWVIESVLEQGWANGKGVFGRVEVKLRPDDPSYISSGEEARWFYVPDQDEDKERAALIRSMMPRAAGKRKETMKAKQYYWKPLGKTSRWDPDDEL